MSLVNNLHREDKRPILTNSPLGHDPWRDICKHDRLKKVCKLCIKEKVK